MAFAAGVASRTCGLPCRSGGTAGMKEGYGEVGMSGGTAPEADRANETPWVASPRYPDARLRDLDRGFAKYRVMNAAVTVRACAPQVVVVTVAASGVKVAGTRARRKVALTC